MRQPEPPTANADFDEVECIPDIPAFVREVAGRFQMLPAESVERALKLLQRELKPQVRSGGRPCGPAVRIALGLKLEGMSWRKVYPMATPLLPGYETMSPDEKTHARQNLRKAVRYHRTKEKKPTQEFLTVKNGLR